MTKANKFTGNSRRNGLFISFLAVVAVIPWPHGGEQVWEYLPFCTAIFVLLAVQALMDPRDTFQTMREFRAALILLCLWLGYTLLQAAPLPRTWIEIFNPQAATLSASPYVSLSIAPGETLLEFIKQASYVAVLLLCLILVNSEQRLLQMAHTAFFSSALMALYSLVNHLTNGAYSLMDSIPPWTISWELATHGTFSYQNHYAAFLNLTIPVGIALTYQTLRTEAAPGHNSGSISTIVKSLSSTGVLKLLLTVIMIVALFMTGSRGGTIVLVVTLGAWALQQLGRQIASTGFVRPSFSLLTAGAILSMAVGWATYSGSLADKFINYGLASNGRDYLRETALSIIDAYPLTGAGAGTYPVHQHQYKVPELGTSEMSKRAHNDYLELLANQGYIGASTLGIGLILLLRAGFSRQQTQGVPSGDMVRAACIAGAFSLLLHSLIDFDFQLPANVVYFVIIGSMAMPLRHERYRAAECVGVMA